MRRYDSLAYPLWQPSCVQWYRLAGRDGASAAMIPPPSCCSAAGPCCPAPMNALRKSAARTPSTTMSCATGPASAWLKENTRTIADAVSPNWPRRRASGGGASGRGASRNRRVGSPAVSSRTAFGSGGMAAGAWNAPGFLETRARGGFFGFGFASPWIDAASSTFSLSALARCGDMASAPKKSRMACVFGDGAALSGAIACNAVRVSGVRV